MTTSLLQMSPLEFTRHLIKNQIRRAFFYTDIQTKQLVCSEPKLEELARFFRSEKTDFNNHEGIFFQTSSKHESLFSAFVHRANRGPGSGGLRFHEYPTMENLIRDALRLSMGMTNKNALAGIWWGGGKGIISKHSAMQSEEAAVREFLFKEYGSFITSLKGCYYTAEDIGVKVEDLTNVFSRTRFVNCIPAEVGGSGNPSIKTAEGVLAGINALFEYQVFITFSVLFC